MSSYTTNDLDEIGFNEFEEKLLKLIKVCEQLKEENIALRVKQAALVAEHSDLMDKNELARTKVTSILSRLKNAEFET